MKVMNDDNNIKKVNLSKLFNKHQFPLAIDSKGVVIGNRHYKNAKLIKFRGNNYIVSNKAVLTITCTSICNASCKFCYNNITFTPNGKYINCNDENLQTTLEFCKEAGVKMVSISGGEPTLYPEKLLKLLSKCKSVFKHKRLHTNGSYLGKEITYNGEKKKLWEHLLDNGITDISISITHYDKDKNSSIMNLEYNEDFEKNIKEMSSKIKVRLSCYMHSKGINDKEALTYVNWGKRLGVKDFIFRFSSGIPNEFSTTSICTTENSLSQNNIYDYVKLFESKGYKIDYWQNKSDSVLYMMSNGNLKVDFDQSSEELDSDKKIRRILYMPDNKVYSSWIDEKSILSF